MSLDVSYINCFIKALRDVMQTMVQLEFSLGKPYINSDRLARHDLCGSITLKGDITGLVVINFSDTIAKKISSQLWGTECQKIDNDCLDAVGEFTNLVIGSAKTDLPGDNHFISVPRIDRKKEFIQYPDNLNIISIPCNGEAGQMIIDIAICIGADNAQNSETLVNA